MLQAERNFSGTSHQNRSYLDNIYLQTGDILSFSSKGTAAAKQQIKISRWLCEHCSYWPVWWLRVGIDSQLSSISALSTDLKRTQTTNNYFWGFGANKTLQTIGQAAEFKFEYKFVNLQVIWQSVLKAIPKDNRWFWLQNQWQSSWGSAPAQLELVGLASTNTGCFPIGSSRCWQQQACLALYFLPTSKCTFPT